MILPDFQRPYRTLRQPYSRRESSHYKSRFLPGGPHSNDDKNQGIPAVEQPKTLGWLIFLPPNDFFKFYLQAPISKPESSTPPTKANSTERGGRKVSDLQPPGQGKKIAEVVLVRLPHGTSPDAKTRTDGRRGFIPQSKGGGNQNHHQDR